MSHFFDCAKQLRKHGYSTRFAPLESTGVPFSETPKSPGMRDDVNSIPSVIQTVVNANKTVIFLSHVERAKEGKEGGLERIAFIAGGVLPAGYKHQTLPFFDFQVGDQRK